MAVREVLTRQALTGNATPRPARPIGAIPVPGFDATYVWVGRAPGAALTRAALTGRQVLTGPAGGILAIADPVASVVALQAWWAFAPSFSITRIEPDGTRTPVRGAESWSVSGDPTRRNGAANPTNAAGDLTGWSAGSNTTIASLSTLSTTPDPRVTTGVQATATAAGSITVSFPLDVISPVEQTYGLAVSSTAAPSSVTISVQWYDASGSSVGVTTHTVAAPAPAEAALGASMCQAVISGGPLGAVFGVPSVVIAGMSAGQKVALTARLWESGRRLAAPYFDGSWFGGNWTGTRLKSPSTLAPVQLITDAEAPFDTPLVYELTNPSTPGYAARSEPVQLTAGGLLAPYDSLLTHPGLDVTVPVWVEEAPDIESDIEQTAYKIAGRPNKVVVSADERSGDEGTFSFVTETLADAAQVREMLRDGAPLLLRSPAEYGYPPSYWLSFGKVGVKRIVKHAWNPVRRFDLPFTEVDRPSVATSPRAA